MLLNTSPSDAKAAKFCKGNTCVALAHTEHPYRFLIRKRKRALAHDGHKYMVINYTNKCSEINFLNFQTCVAPIYTSLPLKHM